MDFSVEAWRGWPVHEPAVGDFEADLDISFVPAMLRRRMSRLSRLMLAISHGMGDQGVGQPCVFASQHGELKRTTSLLRGIATGELMSPTAFSLSVHNSSIGLRSLVYGDRSAGTAIAAGEQTLAMGLIEALGQLSAGATSVLMVYADEELPEEYRESVQQDWAAYALALLIKPAREGKVIRIEAGASNETGELSQQHRTMCEFLAGSRQEVTLGDTGCGWVVRRCACSV